MRGPGRLARWVLAFAVASLALHGSAFAEVTLRLSGVPDRLSFPLPAGSNQVLTVTVSGGKVKSVWLATGRSAKLRVMLDDIGEGRYETNLAAPGVSAVLAADPGARQLLAFAETQAGAVIESIPIQYAVGDLLENLVAVYVYAGGQRHEVLRFPSGRQPADWEERQMLWLMLQGGEGFGYGAARRWFVPERTERLEVRLRASTPLAAAQAQAGDRKWAFSSAEGGTSLSLAVTPEIAKAWGESGTLSVRYSQAGDEVTLATLHAPPSRLDLPAGSATVTIIQRCSKEIPGSNGYLRLSLGDITAGQVLTTVEAADGTVLVEETSVRAGDSLTFRIGEEDYKLTLTRLVNLLIGDDFGVFEVSTTVNPEAQRIRDLIHIVETSDIVFIRNDKEYSGAQAAAHLRSKLQQAEEEVKTLDEFIDKVASRSWVSGQPYRVKLPDGTELEAAVWLRQQAARLTQEQPAAPAAQLEPAAPKAP